MDLAAILLFVSAMLVIALALLTVALMRIRSTTRELERLLAEQAGSTDRAGRLLAVAGAVNSSLALKDVLNVALTQAGHLIGAVAGAMYLVTPGQGEMRRQADYNLTHNAKGASRRLDEEPLRTVVATKQMTVAPIDTVHAPGLAGGGYPTHVLIAPVHRGDLLMGAFELYLPAPYELEEDMIGMLEGVAAQAAIAISHAQLFHAQEENALTDELTKLPNRRFMAQRFLEEMQRARRNHKGLAFLMVDLDHFKHVNDSKGHVHGDTVLADLAKILLAGKREADVCARYGGEEFGIILVESTEPGALVVAERIRSRVEAATFAGGLKLTVSIGVAATMDDTHFTSLLEKADQALYAAKEAGRNTIRVADMSAAPVARKETEQEAR